MAHLHLKMLWIGRKDKIKMEDKLNEVIYEIEKMRKELHQRIDEKCNQLIHALQNGETRFEAEQVLPLSYMPAFFKGKKPIAIVFPNGREVEATTWKKVAITIMQDCNATQQGYDSLRRVSGRISGRQRILLDNHPNEMNVPLKIDEDLYMEGKFDTESLINVMNNLILDVVGYDYSGISIKIKNPIMIASEETAPVTERAEKIDEEIDAPMIQM